jgi:hypothetical protein
MFTVTVPRSDVTLDEVSAASREARSPVRHQTLDEVDRFSGRKFPVMHARCWLRRTGSSGQMSGSCLALAAPRSRWTRVPPILD